MRTTGPTAEIRAFLLLHHDEAFSISAMLDRMGVARGNKHRRVYYDAMKGLARANRLLREESSAGTTYQINLAAAVPVPRTSMSHAERMARARQRYHMRRAAEGGRTLEQFRAEVRAAAEARAAAKAAERKATEQTRLVVRIRRPAAEPKGARPRTASVEPTAPAARLPSSLEWEAAGGRVERLPGIERFVRDLQRGDVCRV